MGNGRISIISLKFAAPLAVIAAVLTGALLFAFQATSHEPLVPVEKASPAQMRKAMARLNEDHDAVTRLMERKKAETEAKEAERTRALDAARDEAANEARRKAEAEAAAVAAREAAQKAATQRKLAEAAPAAKPGPKPEPRKEEVAAEVPVGNPLPIAPQVVQPKRGPIDRAIATANEWTDKTLAAAGAVTSFFTTAAGKLIGGIRPSSNLTSSW